MEKNYRANVAGPKTVVGQISQKNYTVRVPEASGFFSNG
jgi:hypothetical protein